MESSNKLQVDETKLTSDTPISKLMYACATLGAIIVSACQFLPS